MTLAVSDDLPRRWRTYWPDADVERMARDVEARVGDAIAAWGLTGARPLPGGHVSAVLATRDLVLKVSPRGHDDDVLVASQPDALEHWRPMGIVPVLHGRRDDGFTYLMQRVRPGTTLDDAGLGFEDRLRTLGVLAARLHAAGPAPASFVPLADYAARWYPGPLAQPRDDDVLLHADLHGGNVLRDGGGWKVVDPQRDPGDRQRGRLGAAGPARPGGALRRDRPAVARDLRRGGGPRPRARPRLGARARGGRGRPRRAGRPRLGRPAAPYGRGD